MANDRERLVNLLGRLLDRGRRYWVNEESFYRLASSLRLPQEGELRATMEQGDALFEIPKPGIGSANMMFPLVPNQEFPSWVPFVTVRWDFANRIVDGNRAIRIFLLDLDHLVVENRRFRVHVLRYDDSELNPRHNYSHSQVCAELQPYVNCFVPIDRWIHGVIPRIPLPIRRPTVTGLLLTGLLGFYGTEVEEVGIVRAELADDARQLLHHYVD